VIVDFPRLKLVACGETHDHTTVVSVEQELRTGTTFNNERTNKMGPGPSSNGGIDSAFTFHNTPYKMSKYISKVYATGTASADAILAFIVPKAGRLIGMQYSVRATVAAAATENVQFEVSLQSTSQFAVSDINNAILGYFGTGTPTATAGNINFATGVLGGFDVPVEAATKIYVHRSTTAAFSAATVNLLFFFA
jgi:hypothetical protein